MSIGMNEENKGIIAEGKSIQFLISNVEIVVVQYCYICAIFASVLVFWS